MPRRGRYFEVCYPFAAEFLVQYTLYEIGHALNLSLQKLVNDSSMAFQGFRTVYAIARV
jgi:hypothetical protein